MSLKNIPPLTFGEIRAEVLDPRVVTDILCIAQEVFDERVVLDEAEAIALRNWLNEVLAA